MEPSADLRGFRKRWLAGSSSGSAPLAAAGALESELEEEDPSDKHAASSFDVSDSVSKKIRVGLSDIAVESAFKLLRQPVLKMPGRRDHWLQYSQANFQCKSIPSCLA